MFDLFFLNQFFKTKTQVFLFLCASTISQLNVCPSCPQMVDQQMDKALVFEDDVRFQANFKRRVLRLMEEVEQAELDWDLM